jgi:MscS family membrane protein
MLVLAFAAAVFSLFAILGFLARTIISSRHLRKRSLNAHFVRATCRVVAIVVSAYLVIEATEYLGLHLAPVLAGLGIGGLAVALAARPTLENIIGGFTLFADRPVRIGDFCRFGDEAGTVEEIGLRSTRIRRLDDTSSPSPMPNFLKCRYRATRECANGSIGQRFHYVRRRRRSNYATFSLNSARCCSVTR